MFNIISLSVTGKIWDHNPKVKVTSRGQRFENKPVLFIAQTASFDIQKMFVRRIILLFVVGIKNQLSKVFNIISLSVARKTQVNTLKSLSQLEVKGQKWVRKVAGENIISRASSQNGGAFVRPKGIFWY